MLGTMRVPGRSLITWLHLAAVAIALLLLSTARALITGFYRIFPFKPLLDAAYLRSQPLRNLFSLRLAGAPSDKSHAMTAPQLIEAAGYPVRSCGAVLPLCAAACVLEHLWRCRVVGAS